MVYTNSRTNGSRKSRANYSREFKQRPVDATNQPGVSVSKLAQEHGAMPTDVMPKLRYAHAGDHSIRELGVHVGRNSFSTSPEYALSAICCKSTD